MTSHVATERKYLLLLLITASLWSLGGVLIKSVDWNPVAIAGVRSFIAGLVLLPLLIRSRIKITKVGLYGSLFYAATLISFVIATKMTSAANAILLQFTAPIYIALLSPKILGEPIKQRDWIVILFALFGVSLCFLDSLTLSGFIGNCLALLSGICFAGMILSLRLQKQGSPIQSVIIGNIIAALIAIPFFTAPYPATTDCILLLVLGIFQIALPYFLYTIAIKHVSAFEAVLVPVIEPILNPIWVALAIGEIPGTSTLIGGAIVVTSLTVHAGTRASIKPES